MLQQKIDPDAHPRRQIRRGVIEPQLHRARPALRQHRPQRALFEVLFNVPARQVDDTEPGQRRIQQHLRPADHQPAVQIQRQRFALMAQLPFDVAAVARVAVQQAVVAQQIVRRCGSPRRAR